MSYSFLTRQGTAATVTVPVSLDTTGYTVTIEFADDKSFAGAFSKSTTGSGKAVTFSLTSAEVDDIRGSYYRVKAVKGASTRYIQDGSVSYTAPKSTGTAAIVGEDGKIKPELLPTTTSTPSNSVSFNVDAIGARAISELRDFADWCATNNVPGYVGEFGWTRHTDTAQWDAVGEVFMSYMDAADLWGTYWATGTSWSTGYALLPYAKSVGGTDLDTVYGPAAVIERHLSTPRYRRGVNVADPALTAAGFTNANRGTSVYPTVADFTFLKGRGIDTIRLALKWERLQPTLGAALDTTEVNKLITAINAGGALGIKTIIDIHNFGEYVVAGPTSLTLGSDSLTNVHFADLWSRLSVALKGNANILGYGLMNEPRNLIGAPVYTTRATLNTFDTTVENWTSGGATWTSGQSGALLTTPLSNNTSVYAEADNTLRDRSANGTVFWADVFIPANAAGTWDVALQSQTSAFGFLRDPETAFVRLAKGSVTRLRLKLTQPQAAAMRNLQISVGGFSRNGTDTMHILGVWQGDHAGPTGPQVWESASQAAVSAIAANGDTQNIMVGHYLLYNTKIWGVIHSKPWITGAAGKVYYEHHQYFDGADGGVYTKTYADRLADAKSQGWNSASVLARGPAGTVSDVTNIGRSLVTSADAAAARTVIGAGTSNLAIGTTASTAKAGNYAPAAATETAQGIVELATTAEATTGTDTVRAVTPAGLKAVGDTKAPISKTVNFVTDPTTLAIWMAGRHVQSEAAGSLTITIPTNASVAFPQGTDIDIVQGNVGEVIIAPAAGVSLRSRDGATKLAGRYAAATLRKVGTDTWHLYGDIIS